MKVSAGVEHCGDHKLDPFHCCQKGPMRGVLEVWFTGVQTWFEVKGGNGWRREGGDGVDMEMGEEM